MSNVTHRLAVAALAAGALATGNANAAAVSAAVSLNAQLVVGDTAVSDPHTASWGALLSPLNVSTQAAVDDAGSVHGSISASWGADGNSGDVFFKGYGWSVDAPNAQGGSAVIAGPDWTYTFVADFDGTFTMDFDVQGSGRTFGLWGWAIVWSGSTPDHIPDNPSDPTISGTFSDNIVAGQTYTVTLLNNANVSTSLPGPLFGPSNMDGQFRFRIEPAQVPEPGAPALVAAALLALTACRRRRT